MAFVVTSGQLQSVQHTYEFAPRGHGYSASIQLAPYMTQTYEALWRSQPALRSVTSFLARNVASLSVDVYRRISDTDRKKDSTHAVARLLERPVDGTKWTKYRLLNTLMHDLCIFDSAYWVKMRGPDGVRAIQPLPPRMVQPMGKDVLRPQFYRITGTRGHEDIAPESIVHFHGYNPEDGRTGVAPCETLRRILAEEHSASVYREQMWRNGLRSSGQITRPKDAPRWSSDARERFRAEWQSQHTGDGSGVGGVPVLEDGMSFTPSGVTPKDAQYVEGRKLTREEVAVAYHVPLVMLGLMDGVNFSSVVELHKMLYQDTLPPWLTQIAQDIECQLLEDIDPSSARDGSVYVEFNLKGKLAGSFEEQSKALQSAVGGPWMLRNEARAMNNLPSVDDGDELIVPLNVVAGGLASPNDTAPNNPSNEESNKAASMLRDYFARQGNAIGSRLGAGKSTIGDLFDRERWNAELAADAKAVGLDDLPVAAVNEVTRDDLSVALLDDSPTRAVKDLFAGFVKTRADRLAVDLMKESQ